jgi:ABC-type branched-subunit amino acid transport system substrate-binding protein
MFADLCTEVGLTNVGIVADWTSESQKLYSQSTADVFIDAVAAKPGLALAYSDTIANLGTQDEEIYQVVQRLLFSGVRFVYTAFSSTILYKLICATHKQLVQHMGPAHNGVVWLSDLSYIERVITGADLATAGCTRGEWIEASRGVLGSKAVSDGASPEPGGKLPAAWYKEYTKRSIAYNTPKRPTAASSSPYAETTYDSVWMWALALDKMLKGTTTTSAVSLSKLSFPAIAEAGVANVLKTYLQGTSFDGASGRVTIEGKTLDRESMSLILAQISPSSQGGIRPIASYSQAAHTFSTTSFNANGTAGFNITWPTLDGTPPPKGLQVFTNQPPKVYSVNPSVVSPNDDTFVSIVGSNFRASSITINIGEKSCIAPVFKSSTLVECYVPTGYGGPHNIVVICGGAASAPVRLVSYNMPHIYEISKGWVADGSKLLVTGAFFIQYRTKCRLAAHQGSLATVIDETHLECVLRFPDGTSVGKRANLEISNDDGQRWVSGATLNAPIEWGGGTLIPATPRTIDYPDEVVVGGIIPTDNYPGTKGQEYVKDISLAYNIAALSINTAALFPGNIQLRVEMLPVDPGGSGTPNTVTEVATAFAQKGLAKNATRAGPTIHVIGIVGPMWSSNAVPAARAVSNPFRLPMISYDAWSSALDNATEFPYFTRVGPANSDISKVVGLFLRSMGWMSVAVVTDDDAYASDFGKQVAHDVKEHGGTVLYHGIFATLPAQAAVDKQGRLHTSGVKNISSHLFRARERGARVIFTVAKGNAGKIALYDALNDTGFLGEGYAVFEGGMMTLSNELIATGQQQVNGIVHMTTGGAHECKAATCPHKTCGPTCAANARHMNQAHDAVLTLATALAPLFRNGGARYLAGAPESRSAAMTAIRATSLSADIAASGLLELSPSSTKRDTWNFG